MKKQNKKGSAMVLALFAILLFMVMVIGFTYNSRSQSVYNAGYKLNAYYTQTARSVLSEYVADTLHSEWVEPPLNNDGLYADWRFGNLLQSGGEIGKYGVKVVNDGQVFQNFGALDLGYHIWIANNEDDPAVTYTGTKVDVDSFISANWDTDSKVVVTVEVYQNSDPNKVTRATVSALCGPSGNIPSLSYGNEVNLGTATGATDNAGVDSETRINDLNEYRGIAP